jgi:hypothetical protein
MGKYSIDGLSITNVADCGLTPSDYPRNSHLQANVEISSHQDQERHRPNQHEGPGGLETYLIITKRPLKWLPNGKNCLKPQRLTKLTSRKLSYTMSPKPLLDLLSI